MFMDISKMKISDDHRAECEQRVRKLQLMLEKQSINGCVICQNVDLYYFTGSMQTGFLFVPAQGAAVFVVRRSYDRAKLESAVPVIEFKGFSQLATQWGNPAGTIAFEKDVLPVQLFERLQQALPGNTCIDGSPMIRSIRMLKSSFEIQRIKTAAQIVDEVFQQSLKFIRPGLSELELLVFFESNLRKLGHLGPLRFRGFNQTIYNGIVVSGASGAIPSYFDGPAGGLGMSPAFPQGVSHRRIRASEPILIDIGVNIDGYVIDQTRTVTIESLPDNLANAYDYSQTILHAIESQLQPGKSVEYLYEYSLQLADRVGLGDYFMGFGSDQVKFIGHGIGLEVDEWPVLARASDQFLAAGMVIAVEPKFSFPSSGIVGIEDSYLITKAGFERLTVSAQKLFVV